MSISSQKDQRKTYTLNELSMTTDEEADALQKWEKDVYRKNFPYEKRRALHDERLPWLRKVVTIENPWKSKQVIEKLRKEWKL